ncbi:amino acid aldolase [uncultured Microbacterium sp.]|uniref:amino acid aldolase n=1 Tax=uncultured Microbacterium sp. TaxID=191216 RepID=UPI0028DB5308|nr:amino acid aldolase [uncultured Microbacterium sp.]
MTRLDDGWGAERLTARDKGIPERAIGLTVDEFLATEPRLSEFWTPVIALDDTAMRNNLAVMAAWTEARGLQLMPHGKTTMAPALWQRQLDAGCPGITLATMGQVRTARTFGLDSVMLANAVVDARSLRWLAGELADPGFRFVSWADSLDTVDAMERALREVGTPRRVDVCVELGAEGGRTGARTVDTAIEIGRRIAASDVLRLAGVGGYEGALGHDRSDAALTAVRRYLADQLVVHEALGDLYDEGDVFVTAGGSAYFDLVAEVYAPAIARDDRTRFTLRSGAYIVHDDGFYRGISPLDATRTGIDEGMLRSAMRGYARVVSHPEPALALLDGGKRDFPFDEGLPVVHGVAPDLGRAIAPAAGASVTAMNDQHTFLRDADASIGDVVALGLSHPCTAFDKWHFLPVVESAESDRVVELVRTFF